MQSMKAGLPERAECLTIVGIESPCCACTDYLLRELHLINYFQIQPWRWNFQFGWDIKTERLSPWWIKTCERWWSVPLAPPEPRREHRPQNNVFGPTWDFHQFGDLRAGSKIIPEEHPNPKSWLNLFRNKILHFCGDMNIPRRAEDTAL